MLSGIVFVLVAALLWGTTGTAAAMAPGVGPLAIGAAAMGIGGLLQAAAASRVMFTHCGGLTAEWRTVMLSAGAVAVFPLAFYSGLPSRPVMGAVFGLGGILLLPVLALTGAPIISSGSHLAVAAYLAIVPMFLGYILFGHGLATVAASKATTVSLLEPAVAALLGVIVLREHLPPMGWLGLGLLSASLVITATSTRPTATSHPGNRPAEAPDRAVPVTVNADAAPA